LALSILVRMSSSCLLSSSSVSMASAFSHLSLFILSIVGQLAVTVNTAFHTKVRKVHSSFED
jgi:hypothetical protein